VYSYVNDHLLSNVLSYISEFSPTSLNLPPHPVFFELEYVPPGGIPPGKVTIVRVATDQVSATISDKEAEPNEKLVFAPDWILENLGSSVSPLENGSQISVRQVELLPATLLRLRPHSSAFLEAYPDVVSALQEGIQGGRRGVVCSAQTLRIDIPGMVNTPRGSLSPSSLFDTWFFTVEEVKDETGMTVQAASLFRGYDQLDSIQLDLLEPVGDGIGVGSTKDPVPRYPPTLQPDSVWPAECEQATLCAEDYGAGGYPSQCTVSTFIRTKGLGLELRLFTTAPEEGRGKDGGGVTEPPFDWGHKLSESDPLPQRPLTIKLKPATGASSLPEVFASLTVTHPCPERFSWSFLSPGTLTTSTTTNNNNTTGIVLEKVITLPPSDPKILAATNRASVGGGDPPEGGFKLPVYFTFSLPPGVPTSKFSVTVREVEQRVQLPPHTLLHEPHHRNTTDPTLFRRCDNCGHSVSAAAFLLHETQCARLNAGVCAVCSAVLKRDAAKRGDSHLHCTVAPTQCGVFSCQRELNRHVEVCHTTAHFPCSLCKTGAFLPGETYELHLECDCSCRPMTCPFCLSGNTRAKDIDAHMARCGSLSKKCAHCGGLVTNFNWEEHVCGEAGEGGGVVGGSSILVGDTQLLPGPPHMPPPKQSHKEQDIQKITCMGFSRESAVCGLDQSAGNVDRAVDWLLRNAT